MKLDPNNQPWHAAALVGALGIEVAVCTVAGYLVGGWAGNYFGNEKAWLLGGLLTGLSLGIVTAILVIKKVLEDQEG
ncbi:AtpZ/AtpI family protein [Paenibacillus puerhi]|uniref:AtpZ/AtpI family protein n=1 Tax=Paenibacillus puerhi TaxID=2692622 RepID=UPI0013599983|nr:AtpZ/AtpI family protein [Paenibacillus puerhi]